jgi:hypothetical protein
MKPKTIALLIREPQQLGECLSSVGFLSRSASKIQIVLLDAFGSGVCRAVGERLAAFQRDGVECYADGPHVLEPHGFRTLDRSQIAALLLHADVVIPL